MSVPYSQEKSYYRERYKRLKVSKGVIDPYSKKQQLVIVETEPTKVKKSQKTRKSKIPPEIRQEFVNISSRFTKYCKILMAIIFVYIFCYFICESLASQAASQGWSGDWSEFLKFASSVMGAGLQGGLFSLDGKITTYLKSPFGQICFAINKSKLIEGEEADEIVEDLTEINEQCKETLKKFGVLTLAQRLLKFLEAGWYETKLRETSIYEQIMISSYLIPLVGSFAKILKVRWKLREIWERLRDAY